MYLIFSRAFHFRIIVLGVLLFGVAGKGYGQDKKRTYANFQGNLQTGILGGLIIGKIDGAEQAIDGNPKNASTLNIGVGLLGLASSTQFLEFTSDGSHTNARTIPENTLVTLKITLPKSLVGLVDGVSIGIFKDLKAVKKDWPLLGSGHNAGYDADYKKELYSGSSLLNALNGAGEVEITLIPNESYQGVYLQLEGNALSLTLSNNLYHAYILEEANLGCDEKDVPIDVLSGVRAPASIGIANATGSVTNPWNAIDADPSKFALINTGTQILSEVFHTTIFQTASSPGDIVKIVLQHPDTDLTLGLLKGFTIQPYLGSIAVGSPITSSSTFLSLNILNKTEKTYELKVPIAGTFDRIEIKMGGVVDAYSSLRIYNVSRILDSPTFEDVIIDSIIGPYRSICQDESPAPTLKIKDPIQGVVYKWYNSETGGSPLYTGPNYALPAINETTTFYVEAAREGCNPSSRSQVTIQIKELSTITITGDKAVCEGETSQLTASLVGGTWSSSDPTVATISSSGQVTSVKPGNVSITYHLTENGCSNIQTESITVHSNPSAPEIHAE